MTAFNKQDLETVVNGMLKQSQDELKAMADPTDLERYWFFSYDKAASLEWNTYQFNKMLDLYSSKCRRWEEMHNGSCCVVERVRDRYLMPKIKEWISLVQAKHPQA